MIDGNGVPVRLGLRRRSPVRWKTASIGLALLLSTLSALKNPQPSFAATPYEAQIGGFVAAALNALITGEFAGRRPSQVEAHFDRAACGPADFADLRAAANDTATFDAIRRRCKFTEAKIDATHVHIIAYLPSGYCETLKAAFEAVLADQVYGAPRDTTDLVAIDYKGTYYLGSGRALARGAQLEARCQEEGSLRVSAPRKRR
jgi:hypothetical protein